VINGYIVHTNYSGVSGSPGSAVAKLESTICLEWYNSGGNFELNLGDSVGIKCVRNVAIVYLEDTSNGK